MKGWMDGRSSLLYASSRWPFLIYHLILFQSMLISRLRHVFRRSHFLFSSQLGCISFHLNSSPENHELGTPIVGNRSIVLIMVINLPFVISCPRHSLARLFLNSTHRITNAYLITPSEHTPLLSESLTLRIQALGLALDNALRLLERNTQALHAHARSLQLLRTLGLLWLTGR